MELLLDTHALIWFINGDQKLPAKSIGIIENMEKKCFVSIASIWEIAIKISLNKLELNGGFDEIARIMKLHYIEILPVTFEHIQKLLELDFHHRDPFDRIKIAQAMVENLSIVSKDENFPKYKVPLIWD